VDKSHDASTISETFDKWSLPNQTESQTLAKKRKRAQQSVATVSLSPLLPVKSERRLSVKSNVTLESEELSSANGTKSLSPRMAVIYSPARSIQSTQQPHEGDNHSQTLLDITVHEQCENCDPSFENFEGQTEHPLGGDPISHRAGGRGTKTLRSGNFRMATRDRSERDKMEAFACSQCDKFISAVTTDVDGKAANVIKGAACRHRYFAPPPSTPPGLWDAWSFLPSQT